MRVGRVAGILVCDRAPSVEVVGAASGSLKVSLTLGA